MDSSNKKILFGLVIFLIIGGIAAAVYWQKPYLPSGEEEPSLSPKEKCLEDISKMDEEELIAAVENFDYEDASSASVREAKKVLVIKQLFKYLTCEIKTRMRIEDEENEELYLMTKEFVERNTSSESKEEMSRALDEVRSSSIEEFLPEERNNGFFTQLALGDLSRLCPDKLPSVCLKGMGSYIDNKQGAVDVCNNICSLLDQYSDMDRLEKEVIYVEKWDNDDVFLKKQYRFRTAMAYRFGGSDLALEICDIVPADNRDDCIWGVDYLVKIDLLNKECDMGRESLESLMCDIY